MDYDEGFSQGQQVQREKAYSQGIEQGKQMAEKIGFYLGFCLQVLENGNHRNTQKLEKFVDKLKSFSPDFQTIDDDILQIDLEFKKIQSNFGKTLNISSASNTFNESW